MTKLTNKSAKYVIEEKSDNKGDIFGLKLYSRKQNAIIREILVFDTALLFQYSITYPQMLFLDAIQKLWDLKHKVTTKEFYSLIEVK